MKPEEQLKKLQKEFFKQVANIIIYIFSALALFHGYYSYFYNPDDYNKANFSLLVAIILRLAYKNPE